MAVIIVRAEIYNGRVATGKPIYQMRIMDSAVARYGHAWYRDIDFWLFDGLGWLRGRNARAGRWG